MPPSKKTGRGRRQIQRERFHLDFDERPALIPTVTINDLLPGVLGKMGMEAQYREHVLVSDWPSIVGPQVAQHTRPGRIYQKTLTVFVGSTIWLTELMRFGRDIIAEKVRARIGAEKIRDVRLELDPDIAQRSFKPRKPSPPPG
jgi:hypothetical protein